MKSCLRYLIFTIILTGITLAQGANPPDSAKVLWKNHPEFKPEVAKSSATFTLQAKKKDSLNQLIDFNVGNIKIIQFDTPESTDLTDTVKKYLDRLADFLADNPDYKVKINGHSDNSGTYKQNQDRSKNRANAVMNYLASKGVDKGRLYPVGYGPMMPVANNETEEGRKKNSRVEIQIIQ